MDQNENGVQSTEITRTISKGKIIIEKISKSNFQKAKTETAQLRQEITMVSNYPTSRVSNSAQDSLSPAEDFGFESNSFTSKESRVAFPLVAEGTTMAQAEALVANNPEACLYKVLSNDVILTEDQLSAIQRGLRTKDEFANTQVVRFPTDHATTPNQLIKDINGKVMYRQVYFSKTAKDDVDHRGVNAPSYMSPEIKAELESTPISASTVRDQQLS